MLEDIVEKLVWKHHVEEHEVIELLENKPFFQRKEPGYVYTRDKRAIIVSARDMSEKERRRYTLVSNAGTYQEIGAFWDDHDATEFGEQTNAMFQVNVSSQRRYYPLDRDLSFEIKRIAEQHGISEETLLNLWVQEKTTQSHTVGEEHGLTKSSS